MRSVDEIVQKLGGLIEETTLGRVAAATITPEKALIEDLGLDSLDYATTMLGCEEWLGAKVNEGAVDWRKIRSVGELAQLLHGAQK